MRVKAASGLTSFSNSGRSAWTTVIEHPLRASLRRRANHIRSGAMKTSAAVLWEVGTPWSVEEIELDPPRTGEVLIELRAAGLCHTDDHYRTGDMAAELPLIGGHEGAGVVVECGPGVRRLRVGDH